MTPSIFRLIYIREQGKKIRESNSQTCGPARMGLWIAIQGGGRMLSIGKRPMRLPMKIIGNVMAIGIALAGCGTYAEFQFVDWTRLEGFDQSMNEAAISDLLLRDDIELICHLSPYTSSLNPEDRGLESALKEEDLLGVNGTREGY